MCFYFTFEGRKYLKFYTIADWSARLLDSRGIARQTRPCTERQRRKRLVARPLESE